jgi:hypothetical protein
MAARLTLPPASYRSLVLEAVDQKLPFLLAPFSKLSSESELFKLVGHNDVFCVFERLRPPDNPNVPMVSHVLRWEDICCVDVGERTVKGTVNLRNPWGNECVRIRFVVS